MPLTNKTLRDENVEKFIYGYYHIPTERYLYVGITTNPSKRNRQHRQRTCKQYDAFHDMLHANQDDFMFVILEHCLNGIGREEWWIDLLEPMNISQRDRNSGVNNPMYGKSGNLAPKSKTVLQFDLAGHFLGEYGSTREAERETGIDHQNIAKVCKGKYQHAGHYWWVYKKDYINEVIKNG